MSTHALPRPLRLEVLVRRNTRIILRASRLGRSIGHLLARSRRLSGLYHDAMEAERSSPL